MVLVQTRNSQQEFIILLMVVTKNNLNYFIVRHLSPIGLLYSRALV